MLKVSNLIGAAVANCSGAMEADTISKNGWNSKNQMSRINFRFRQMLPNFGKVVAIIAIFMICVVGAVNAQTEPNAQQSEQKLIVNGDTIKLPNVLTLYQDSVVNKPFLNFLEDPKNPKNFEIQVYNRFGELMHKGNNGWNGIYRKQRVQEGAYFYVAKLKNDDEYQLVKGTVTVKYENDIKKE